MPEVMQVIPKTYDLVLWLVPRLTESPLAQRFLLADWTLAPVVGARGCQLLTPGQTPTRSPESPRDSVSSPTYG